MGIRPLTFRPYRRRALKEMCPCRVKGDIDLFWARVFEMIQYEWTFTLKLAFSVWLPAPATPNTSS